MKNEDFGHHELHSVQKLVIFIREGSEAYAFKDIEEKDYRGEVAVKYDTQETPICANTPEYINALLLDSYEVDDDRLPDPDNTLINTGKTYQPVYK